MNRKRDERERERKRERERERGKETKMLMSFVQTNHLSNYPKPTQSKNTRQPLTYLSESGGAGSHEDLSDSVVEPVHLLLVDAEEALGSALLRHFVLQIPNAVAVSELLLRHPALGQDSEGSKTGRDNEFTYKY